MFGFLIRSILLGIGVFGNFDISTRYLDKKDLSDFILKKSRLFSFLCNYIAILALCFSFVKKFKIFRWIHSFLITFSLSTQFTSVFIYWTYKRHYPTHFTRINTGDRRKDILIEYSQHFVLFLACLIDPFFVNIYRKFMRLILLLFSISYVIFNCYVNYTTNTWIYSFMKEVDNIKRCTFFALIIILPQFFYKFLQIFMPRNTNKTDETVYIK